MLKSRHAPASPMISLDKIRRIPELKLAPIIAQHYDSVRLPVAENEALPLGLGPVRIKIRQRAEALPLFELAKRFPPKPVQGVA